MIWKKQPVGSKLADLQNNKASKDAATQSAAGLMSASDKTKLDGVATGATAVSVVNNLNSDSTTSALSAAQGKALNSNLTNLSNTVKQPDSLTITRINNSFADASSIGRLSCRKVGSTVHFHGNLALTAGTTSDFVDIAEISDWRCFPEVYTTVPAQNDSSKIIIVRISPDTNTNKGTVSFYAPNGVATSFYRFFITMPYANA